MMETSLLDEEKKDVLLKAECSVCSSPAAIHLHYGAISCYSCRAFFRRGPPRQIRCIFGHNACKITRYNRTNCKQCRYTRCLHVGMVPDKVDATLNKKKEREAKMRAEQQQEPNLSPTSGDHRVNDFEQHSGQSEINNYRKEGNLISKINELQDAGGLNMSAWDRKCSRSENISWDGDPRAVYRPERPSCKPPLVRSEQPLPLEDVRWMGSWEDKDVRQRLGQRSFDISAATSIRREGSFDGSRNPTLWTERRESTQERRTYNVRGRGSGTIMSEFNLNMPNPDSIYERDSDRRYSETTTDPSDRHKDKCSAGTSTFGKYSVVPTSSFPGLSGGVRAFHPPRPTVDQSNLPEIRHHQTRHAEEFRALQNLIGYQTSRGDQMSSHRNSRLPSPPSTQISRKTILELKHWSKLSSDQESYGASNDDNELETNRRALRTAVFTGRENLFDQTFDWLNRGEESRALYPGDETPIVVPRPERFQQTVDAELERTRQVPDILTVSKMESDMNINEITAASNTNQSWREGSTPQVVPELGRNFSVIQGPYGSGWRPENLHNIADFRTSENVPKPIPDPRIVLYQSFRRRDTPPSLSLQLVEDGEKVSVLPLLKEENGQADLYSPGKKRKINEDKAPEEEEEGTDVKCNDRTEPVGAGSPVPLKKRPRMYQLSYPIGHGINKTAIPVLTFTFEEEFMVMDYVVRIEQYLNGRFQFLRKNFKHYNEMLVSYVKCTNQGCKIPFSKKTEKTLFHLGLEFSKSCTSQIFKEMASLTSEVRRTVLNSTYSALYVVFFSILEGNTSEKTWLDQHKKTLYITQEHHEAVMDDLAGLAYVRSISIKDQERFTSPWARDIMDEEKFENVVAIVGRILRDDLKLQALYHMLVMFTPSIATPAHVQADPRLQTVQVHLVQLIYRYLTNFNQENQTKPFQAEPCYQGSVLMNLDQDLETLSPADKTHLLISLIDDLHDCADIMQNRSLPGCLN